MIPSFLLCLPLSFLPGTTALQCGAAAEGGALAKCWSTLAGMLGEMPEFPSAGGAGGGPTHHFPRSNADPAPMDPGTFAATLPSARSQHFLPHAVT